MPPSCISPQGRSYRRTLRNNIFTSLQAQFSNTLLSWEQLPLTRQAVDLNLLNISHHLGYVGLDCRNAASHLICKQYLQFAPSTIFYLCSAPRSLASSPFSLLSQSPLASSSALAGDISASERYACADWLTSTCLCDVHPVREL